MPDFLIKDVLHDLTRHETTIAEAITATGRVFI
jgi:hypothetical protein